MGMDAYIFKAKTKKVFEDDSWYNKVEEVWYARKYWNLVEQLPFIDSIDNDRGEFIQLKKDDIDKMIEIATHTPDYWNGFDSVPALCKILQNFDDDAENGWNYYFEFDY